MIISDPTILIKILKSKNDILYSFIDYFILLPINMSNQKDEKDDYQELKNNLSLGWNIFLTGPGGVGKSYYINKLKDEYRQKYYEDYTDEKEGNRYHFCVTSTTGVSAFNLGAQTIHSFSGIGILKPYDTIDSVMKRVKKMKTTRERIQSCRILVIDEISMLGTSYFEMLDQVFRKIKNTPLLFGGIQVILTGDFLQLPPINDKFCFQSELWTQLELKTIYLTKMYRVNDPVYTGILERARIGRQTEEDNDILYSRVDAFREMKIDYTNQTIQPTFLYSKKVNVNDKNKEELDKNPNELLIFQTEYTDLKEDLDIDKIKMDNDTLYLKVGCQVMLTVNLDVECGLVNGSRGIITDYDSRNRLIQVKFLDGSEMSISRHITTFEDDNGKVLYRTEQFPLMLAYALSIHKVQGSTLDFAVINLGQSIFEESMSYVALSRVRNLKGLFLEAFKPRKIFCSQDALLFYESLKQ